MKINTTRSSAFQPVNLNLTFETQAELDCFIALSSLPSTISKEVQRHTSVRDTELSVMLAGIYNQLTKEG